MQLSRRHQTREEEIAEALALIREMPHTPHPNSDFVLLKSDPAEVIKHAKRCSKNYARGLTREIRDKGLLIYVANGGETRPDGRKSHAWLLKPAEPIENPQQKLDLDADGDDVAVEISELNSLFRKVAGRVHDLEAEIVALRAGASESERVIAELREEVGQSKAELLERNQEAESLRSENTTIKDENKTLREQVDQIFRALGRIDLDVLRGLVTNEPDTRED
jgi:FtsZ-binding cell division protein ZapB